MGNPQPNPTSPKKNKNNAEQKKKKKLNPKNGAPTRNNETTTKYKLMSSAKLLISKFMCLTIPPGLNLTSFLESPVLLSLMPQKKSKRMHCKPKLRILRLETQITKLDTKMNQSGLNLMVMTCGCSWWLLMMVTIGVVVEACGGAMKGQ